MRLIAADKLEDVLAKHQALYYGDSDYYEGISQGFNLAIYDVKEAQTIDAEPIRHGHWEAHDMSIKDVPTEACSICGEWSYGYYEHYCPKCGALMDEVIYE